MPYYFITSFNVFVSDLDDIENSRSQRILEELESIDDDCDRYGISFVKIDDDRIAAEYGIDTLPALVYFENKMPNFFQGILERQFYILTRDVLLKYS